MARPELRPGSGSPRLPNLIIAGVSRAGTTSLFNYLEQHPDVCVADVKEPEYFTPLAYGRELEPFQAYLDHFAHCRQERVVLEATPGYFYGGHTIAASVEQSCPGVRIVVSLRRPEDRCWSWFQFVKSRLRIPKEMTFSHYLDRCLELHAAGRDHDYENRAFWGLGGGCYSRWLGAWTAEFGPRFRLVFFDDVVQDTGAVLTSLAGWLGIDPGPFHDVGTYEVHNRPQPYRNRALQRVALTTNRRGQTLLRKHPAIKRSLRRAYYAVNRDRPEGTMSPADRLRLEDFYRPYNRQLARQLETMGLEPPRDWSLT